MPNEPVDLKDIVEIPAKSISAAMGLVMATSRMPLTEYTAASTFSDVSELLSDRPLRRPASRKLS